MQEPYQDSPPDSRASTPTSSSGSSESTIKPLPRLPNPLPFQPTVPYRDERSSEESTSIAAPQPSRYHPRQYVNQYYDQSPMFQPYTDSVPDDEDDDNVPLAYLYPTEAPPSYMAAVTQSYRDTLITHIRNNSNSTATDEEENADPEYLPEDERFRVEKVVAIFVVAFLLSALSGLMVVSVVFYQDGRFRW